MVTKRRQKTQGGQTGEDGREGGQQTSAAAAAEEEKVEEKEEKKKTEGKGYTKRTIKKLAEFFIGSLAIIGIAREHVIVHVNGAAVVDSVTKLLG